MPEKICPYCGKILTSTDPKSGHQCMQCALKRMSSWWAIQAEAKQKFDKDWPRKYG